MTRYAIFICMALCAHAVSAQTVELSVDCTEGQAPTSQENYAPANVDVTFLQDTKSRYVYIELNWNRPIIPSDRRFAGWLIDRNLGFEFKTYQYNYDDAASTGLGPAFILGPGMFAWCNIPGCYVDTDLGSATNSVGEYNEPQVAFGMAPGNARSLVYDGTGARSVRYAFYNRVVAGRGSRSVTKARFLATKALVPVIGSFGIFTCQDTPPISYIEYADRVFSPVCINSAWYPAYNAQGVFIGYRRAMRQYC